jgi:hypothetical protein
MDPTPTSFKARILNFFNTLPNPPYTVHSISTVSAFCDSIQISKDSVSNLLTYWNPEPCFHIDSQSGLYTQYIPTDDEKEIKVLTSKVLTKLESIISSLALQGKIWYNIANFYLKNDFNYQDKKEVATTAYNTTHNTTNNLNQNINYNTADFWHIEKLLDDNGFR